MILGEIKMHFSLLHGYPNDESRHDLYGNDQHPTVSLLLKGYGG